MIESIVRAAAAVVMQSFEQSSMLRVASMHTTIEISASLLAAPTDFGSQSGCTACLAAASRAAAEWEAPVPATGAEATRRGAWRRVLDQFCDRAACAMRAAKIAELVAHAPPRALALSHEPG